MKRLVLFLAVFFAAAAGFAQYLRYASGDSVAGKPRFEGYVQVKLKLNGVYDLSGGLQGYDVFNIEKINVWESDDTPNLWMDMYQSQIRISGTRQINGYPATGYVEGDFWGGNGQFRLRTAYVRYRFFQFGQDWSFFGDKNVWPNVFDWDGPPTGVWSRAAHLQLFFDVGNKMQVEAGIARQRTEDIDFEGVTDPRVKPSSGQPFPDIIAAVNQHTGWGHWRITGVFRRISFYVDDQHNKYAAGWGVTTSGLVRINPMLKNSFQYQFVVGSGIASYLASFGGSRYNGLADGYGNVKTIPVVGGWLAYEHYVAAKWHFNLVCGFNQLRTKTLASNPFDYDKVPLTNGVQKFRGLYMLGNVMFDPFENFTIGLEYNYGYKLNMYDGTIGGIPNSSTTQSRDASRISFGLFYSF
jgi:hypothetical protein